MNFQRRYNNRMPFNLENEFRRTHRRSDRASPGIGCLPNNAFRRNSSGIRFGNNRRRQRRNWSFNIMSRIFQRAEQFYREALSGPDYQDDSPRMYAQAPNMNRRGGSRRRREPERMHAARPSSPNSSDDSNNFALHHFEVGSEIGRGGMGKILEARLKQRYQERWRHVPRKVALKVIRVTSHNRPMVRNEISAHRQMANCPHVVKYYGDFVHRDYQYIVLERLEGPSLARAIRDRKYLSERQALVIMKDVLNALKYMHRKRIAHLDISPMNVMFRKKWASSSGSPPQACVIDFGLTTRFDTVLGARGTPGYTAPEVIRNSSFVTHPAIDMFSAGVVLYEMLKGRSPFRSSNWDRQLRKMRNAPLRPSEMSDLRNVSTAVKSIIASCLRWEPSGRPSAGRMVRDVENCL